MSFRFSLRTLLFNLDQRIQLIVIGFLVGVLGGFAALALNAGLEHFPAWLGRATRAWTGIWLPAAGIVLAVLALKYVIRDPGGHGVPEVIASVSLSGGRLPLRSSFSKLLGSLLTISAGGSAGPEAPVAISGAAIGSNTAGYFRSSDRVRVAAAGSGAAAAIASIFNAPLAGFIFSMEVILGEWSNLNMLPVAIASVTGTVVSRIFHGNQIPFVHRPLQVGVADILGAAGLSMLMAVLGALFIRSLKLAQAGMRRILPGILARAAVGGLLIGLIAWRFPEIRGEGYHVVREVIGGGFEAGAGLLLILILLKIIATSITLGAGGSGGVFAPALVVGSLAGAFYAMLLNTAFPGAGWSSPVLFTLCGMAGMLSGTLHAPLTGIFLIVEITGGYDGILPLVLVSFLTHALARRLERNSIYFYELVEKGYLRRPRTDARILTDIHTGELLEKDLEIVRPEMSLNDILPLVIRSKRNLYPVVDADNGEYLGMVDLNIIKKYLFDPDLRASILVEEVMRTDLPQVSSRDDMVRILRKLDSSGAWSLPVVEGKTFKGLVSKSTILDHYRKELKAQTEE